MAQWALVREIGRVIVDGRLGYIQGIWFSFKICCQDMNIWWLLEDVFMNPEIERRSQFQFMTLHQSSLLYIL